MGLYLSPLVSFVGFKKNILSGLPLLCVLRIWLRVYI